MTITEEYSIDIRVTSEQGKNDYANPPNAKDATTSTTPENQVNAKTQNYKPPLATSTKADQSRTNRNHKT
ncbi:hypothetical protein M5028_10500, partial [Neisseria meningitidis]|nr:hypothetical protein [Neisseria meningitidis]